MFSVLLGATEDDESLITFGNYNESYYEKNSLVG